MAANPAQVVILGGGFAGLRVALQLARHARSHECQVTLVDRETAHVNPQWLYEVATAFNPFEQEAVGDVLHASASVPFARILHGSGVAFIQRTVEHVDLSARLVRYTSGETQQADLLVLALGCQLATFRVPGVDTHAFSIKTIHEAIALRAHLVRQFLRYRSASRARQEAALRVVVVGGGSAGVELAAELVFFLRRLARLHGVDESTPRVVLVEATETILREYPERLRRIGLKRLADLGVEIRSRHAACAVGADHVVCSNDFRLQTETVVWLAGIRTHDVLLRLGVPVHAREGVVVEPTLELRGFRGVFAAGDCVYAHDPESGRTVPDVAYAAIQQGTVVAENILRRLRGHPLGSFVDRPRPTYATVGGKFALVSVPPWQLTGVVGWWLKQAVDLKYLFSILPNDLAVRLWHRNVRVRVANDLPAGASVRGRPAATTDTPLG